jgi:hypothetical protein
MFSRQLSGACEVSPGPDPHAYGFAPFIDSDNMEVSLSFSWVSLHPYFCTPRVHVWPHNVLLEGSSKVSSRHKHYGLRLLQWHRRKIIICIELISGAAFFSAYFKTGMVVQSHE